ncbi:MAG: hypothetical protein ACLSBH_20900 [Coprobacillus cateniformis]
MIVPENLEFYKDKELEEAIKFLETQISNFIDRMLRLQIQSVEFNKMTDFFIHLELVDGHKCASDWEYQWRKI